MPFYFRKRPGSKNFFANLTQRGLSSFTLTTGGKKGQLRLNRNSKRGFSASIPGTGLMWRQKGYGNADYKSVVEERGYDLRTKEGREQHAKERFNHNASLACVIIGVGSAWLFESPNGLWVGYLLFWILFAIGEKSIRTFIWALLAHVGAAIGYALSFVFNSEPLELSIWGMWLASFLFSIVFRRIAQFLFFLAAFVGIWAFLGEPSLYFEQMPLRISSANFIFPVPNFNSVDLIVYPILNLYGGLLLVFGFVYYVYLQSNLINEWKASNTVKNLVKIGHFLVFFIILFPLTVSLGFAIAIFIGFKPEKLDNFIATPILFLMGLIYSMTFGLYINRKILGLRKEKINLFTSIFHCFMGLFWLPILGQVSNKKKIIERTETIAKKTLEVSEKAEARQLPDILKDEYTKTLQTIWGLGVKKQNALLEAYPDAQLFLMASDEDVSYKTKSLVGKKMAKKIRFALVNN